MDGAADGWFDDELDGCRFADERLNKRLRKLLKRMAGAMGQSIPLACQDWANTKAAYRFFSNDRVSEEEILAGHFQSTRSRFAAAPGPILVLHDTTEFTYQRERADSIGITYRVNSGKDKSGRFRMHTVCGLLMHSSLAVTLEGLPLGLSAIKFWTRSKFKGTVALKKKINPTRVPIEQKESFRWLENMRQSMALFGDPARCTTPSSGDALRFSEPDLCEARIHYFGVGPLPVGDLMRTIAIAAVAVLVLSGCAGPTVAPGMGYSVLPAPPVEKGMWLRTDGQSGKNNPAIAQQFAADKAACGNGIDVDRECMAQRGYLLVPESQVETKAAELRAAARSAPPR